eukprot:XP_001699485.1 predicted protein [Chlamydomonas reinhardtii]
MVITEVRQDGTPVDWSGSRLVGNKDYTVIAEPAASIFQVLQNGKTANTIRGRPCVYLLRARLKDGPKAGEWVNVYLGCQQSDTLSYSRWDAYLVHGKSLRWSEPAKWAGWAWLLTHCDAAELRFIDLSGLTKEQVFRVERSFLDKYDFPFNSTDNRCYRLTVATFWGSCSIPKMPIELRRWVGEEWWYAGLANLEQLLVEPGDLANSLGKPAQSVACAADGALNTRNEFTHPGSVAAMDQEVSEMMELITPPELEDKCPEECMFLTAYEDIKNAFPHRFSQVCCCVRLVALDSVDERLDSQLHSVVAERVVEPVIVELTQECCCHGLWSSLKCKEGGSNCTPCILGGIDL